MGIEGNNRADGIAREAAELGPGAEVTTGNETLSTAMRRQEGRMGYGVATKTHDDHSHPH